MLDVLFSFFQFLLPLFQLVVGPSRLSYSYRWVGPLFLGSSLAHFGTLQLVEASLSNLICSGKSYLWRFLHPPSSSWIDYLKDLLSIHAPWLLWIIQDFYSLLHTEFSTFILLIPGLQQGYVDLFFLYWQYLSFSNLFVQA